MPSVIVDKYSTMQALHEYYIIVVKIAQFVIDYETDGEQFNLLLLPWQRYQILIYI